MGKRGTKPTPTAVLEKRGSWLAKTRKDEPRPEPELPPCPSWLSYKAKRYWREIGQQLYDIDVMTGLDRISLALLADATVDYIEARKELDQEGRTSLTRRGHATSPEYRNLLASSERLLRLLREFGLTPSSRVGVKKSDKPAHGNSKDKTRFIQAVK